VSRPSSNNAPGKYRVQVEVESETIWFESPDVELTPSIEAIGSAFAIPSAADGKEMTFASPPDPVWLANVRQAQAVAAKWWGYDLATNVTSGQPAPMRSGRKPALCFTCGVDSFYSLLRGGHQVDRLLFVQGFDIPLADRQRARDAEASARRVAAELGLGVAVVRTNLRTHRGFAATNWEHTHGGALAAIGHLLSDHADQLLISASYPRVFDRPWGSHWELDPWWSSSRLNVAHVGAEKWRAEKLVALMHEPLVRQHLRVCWENRSPSGNCGQCEKCLRTMLVLDGHGCLEQFSVFPPASTLAAGLEQLSPLKNDLIRVYAGFLEMNLSAKVRSALAALVHRSARQLNQPTGQSWRRQHA
jgi:hypothetical protein